MNKLFTTTLGQFRIVSFSEGVSYILLMAIAVPVKYMADEPILVRILGPIHGFLFIAFMVFLGKTAVELRWRMGRVLIAFIASLLPLGAFFLEVSLKKEMERLEQQAPE
ncbi:DUF3817 domain-containing protein [Sulfidibacter corallicola]|uniref:DUF3817 domain-containing protein n=1 Tax=Sulfidibacter corallicola TaxID=2818388 RepID=A0A8A4TQM5_SULCO|nr:DUF3817 domain-containing protein [Sulfidibacter corallicola]QTD51484.1 DUF3817 domain-containing protein [Sulfidibacter corallicola]